MAAAFSPGPNGAKSGMLSVACAPDVLIARLEVGLLIYSRTVPDSFKRKTENAVRPFGGQKREKEPVR
jgi:hypothetical protein